MRRFAKVDANQKTIVAALRDAGVSVKQTHMVGQGFPDLACGFRGKTYLLEVKDGSRPPSERRLTPDEAAWFEEWRGHAEVVCCIEEALAAVGIGGANE